MHPLLRRQLRRLGLEEAGLPKELLDRISRTYQEADRDRYTLERSFELSSAEMAQLYDELRVRSETELARKAVLLERSLALADAVQEASLDGILIVGEAQRVLGFNKRFLEIWRIPESPAGERSDAELIELVVSQLEDPDAFLAKIRGYYEQPDAVGRDELRLRDGRILDRYTSPVRTPAGDPGTRVWSFRDVTNERKLAADRLVLAERMASIGRVAASVGHEINNPLCCARLTIEQLVEELTASGAASAAELAREAHQALARIQQIVLDLGNLARGPEEHEPVDLVEVVDAALQTASNELRHRARVVREIAGRPRVVGNQGRLGQVLLNLLVNAAQAIPEGRAQENQVRVRVDERLGLARIVVEDSGTGIAAGDLERIFDPFFSTKTFGAGSGLGLSICKSIVEAHGGRILVESTMGRGSSFVVELPSAGPQVVPTRRPLPSDRARVLVIDDDDHMRSALVRAFRTHEVTACGDARAGLAALAEDEFDLVLCDLMMPDLTGMDFYEQAKERWPERVSSIVFLTGGAFSERAQLFLSQTECRCLFKPVALPTLRALVSSSVEQRPRT